MDFSVYVHVPYCRVQCPYCTFFTVVSPAARDGMQAFVAALGREWALRVRPRLEAGDRPRTLYVGGGTPSELGAADLAAFLGHAGADVPGGLSALDEVTVECNPESATEERLEALRAAGVGRISLGVQALDARDLEALGRPAGVAEARAAMRAVASTFATWNADLILGIPGSNAQRLRGSLEELGAVGAPHISLYCLELPPGRARSLGEPAPARADAAKAALYEMASAWVEAHGYVHYEISNAARPGHEARHNCAYWLGREYIGLGPGAHSAAAGVRRANRPHLGRYVEALLAGADAPSALEVLTEAQKRHERVLLGLRLREGVPTEVLETAPGFLDELARRGLARLEGGRLRLTPAGWLVSDAIVLQLVAT